MIARFSLACVVLLLSTIDVARAASPATLPSQGHVTSSDGKPVAGATVWVIGEPEFRAPRVLLKTATKADGSFDLPTVPVQADDSSTLSVVVRADGFGLCGSTRTFEVMMPPAVPVAVKLQRPDGKPAAGVKVAPVQLVAGHGGFGTGPSWFARIPDELLGEFAVTSDADGIATFPSLPQDARVGLHVLDESYARTDYRERIVVPKSADPAPVPMRLLAGGVIEGRLVDADGKPVAGVYVSAQGTNVSSTTGGTTYTDEQGRYALKQMRPGTFNVAVGLREELGNSWTAVAHESVSLAEGQRLTGKDFQLIPGTLITGKVMDADTHKPLAGLSVGVYGPAHPKSGGWVQSAKSGADGTYQLRVPPGDQYVYFMGMTPEGYLSAQPASKEVTVTDAQGTSVDFLLPRDKNPPLSGQVIDAAGKPVPQARVTLQRSGDGPMIVPDATKITDDQGEFEFAAVPRGSTLRAVKGKTGTLEPVTVNGAEDITLIVEEDYLTNIAGVVTDLEGKPIAGAKVSLTRMHGSFGIGTEPRPTDANGRYSFDDLPVDGRYSVSAYGKGYGEAQANVRLRLGPVNEAPALKLARADSFVAGKVVDADGKPVAGVTVYLMINRGERPEAITDQTGAFRFDGVVAGKQVTVYTMSANGKSIGGQANAKPGTSDTVLTLPAGLPAR